MQLKRSSGLSNISSMLNIMSVQPLKRKMNDAIFSHLFYIAEQKTHTWENGQKLPPALKRERESAYTGACRPFWIALKVNYFDIIMVSAKLSKKCAQIKLSPHSIMYNLSFFMPCFIFHVNYQISLFCTFWWKNSLIIHRVSEQNWLLADLLLGKWRKAPTQSLFQKTDQIVSDIYLYLKQLLEEQLYLCECSRTW